MRRTDAYRYNDAIAVDRYELDCGLVVLHLPSTAAPVFSYQTWLRVGSRHEVAGKTGIAHLFEHLMFKGTHNTPEGVFDRTLEGFGGRVNAATWLDWTFYYEDLPAAHFEEVARLEADRLEHLRLEPDPVEAERKVVMNERKERVENDPGGKLSELLWSTAFERHPYGRPTLGWMEDIEAISIEDCLAFYRTYYAPNNAVVVVTGDVDAARLERAMVSRYGHLRRQAVPPPPPIVEPRQTAARRVEHRLQVSSERLLMAYHSPAVTDPAHAALEVLNELLFEGDSARLQRALVTDGELAASFYSFVSSFAEPGLYEVSVDLRPGRCADEAEEVVLRELGRVLRDGISEAELAKATAKLETRFYRQLQTVQQRAQGLGFWEVTAGDFRRLFTLADRYREVSTAGVAEVAAEVLRPENRTVVCARPLA